VAGRYVSGRAGSRLRRQGAQEVAETISEGMELKADGVGGERAA
jgi:hypothetical protein